jgi:hypothetical protein
MKGLIIILSAVLLSCLSCSQQKNSTNYSFDMGAPGTIPAERYQRVDPSQNYSAARGWGWLTATAGYSDSANKKLSSPLYSNGVYGADSLVFRADVTNGDYWLTVIAGSGRLVDTSIMTIAVNEENWPDTVQLPWERLAFRTIAREVKVSDGKVIVKVKGKNASICAIELKPVMRWPAMKFTTPLETDTLDVQQQVANWEKAGDTTSTVQYNLLQDCRRYLLACSYVSGGGWSWASKKTGMSAIHRCFAAADLLASITADEKHPLHDRATYLLARVYYWLDLESGYDDLEKLAKKYFNKLQEKYPDHTVLKMYRGEKIPNTNVTLPESDAPSWAVAQREVITRMSKLIEWWVTQRQTPNGELGGKYGDDVEILRWWLPAVLGADDSLARLGYTRLADGVWNSDAMDRGFARRIDDVEHAAELFRDTHPGMFMVQYGDPEYVERCLISMQHFQNVWTSVNEKGHRHFKSYYLSASKVLDSLPFDVDVALNARAVLPGLWATWYSQHPRMLQLFGEWCKAWIEDAARAGNGKPAGVLPSAIRYRDDRIGGYSDKWYEPGLSYDYYQWDHLSHVNELLYHMLGMYSLTGDKQYLQPTELLAKWMNEPVPATAGEPGSEQWVRYQLNRGGHENNPVLHPMSKLFSMALQLTGDTLYTKLVNRYGQAFNKYTTDGDVTWLEKGLNDVLQSLRYNFPLQTNEALFTDRIYVKGSNVLMGMYTGHFGAGYEFPGMAVSWKNTGNDVAVFVRDATDTSLHISLYNFDAAREVVMQTWRLKPGRYTVSVSAEDKTGNSTDTKEQELIVNEQMEATRLSLQPQRGYRVTVKPVEFFNNNVSRNLADMAIAPRDVTFADKTVHYRIHNIGSKEARNVKVTLLADGKEIGQQQIAVLAAPLDLVPRIHEGNFPCELTRGQHRLTIKIETTDNEITKLNNETSVTVNVLL